MKIDGLIEIKKAIGENSSDVDILKKKYTRAKNYLIAEEWYLSDDKIKSDLGREAIGIIVNNPDNDGNDVIINMEDKWETNR